MDETSRTLAARLSLLLAILAAGVDLGGSIYEHALVFPLWSAEPPRSFALIQPERGGLTLTHFWIPVHGAVTLALIATLALHWRARRERKLIAFAFAAYLAMRAWTFAYFIPEISAFMATPPDSDASGLVERAARWGMLSHGRTLLVLLMSGCLIAAAVPSLRARRERAAP